MQKRISWEERLAGRIADRVVDRLIEAGVTSLIPSNALSPARVNDSAKRQKFEKRKEELLDEIARRMRTSRKR